MCIGCVCTALGILPGSEEAQNFFDEEEEAMKQAEESSSAGSYASSSYDTPSGYGVMSVTY